MDEARGAQGCWAIPLLVRGAGVLSEGREVNSETKKEKRHLHMGRLSSETPSARFRVSSGRLTGR